MMRIGRKRYELVCCGHFHCFCIDVAKYDVVHDALNGSAENVTYMYVGVIFIVFTLMSLNLASCTMWILYKSYLNQLFLSSHSHMFTEGTAYFIILFFGSVNYKSFVLMLCLM